MYNYNAAQILATVVAVVMTSGGDSGHSALAVMSVPQHFNITITYAHGNSTQIQEYDDEGSFTHLNTTNPKELPWNITGVTFADTYYPGGPCYHFFAVCTDFPAKGPTALIFYPEFDNQMNLSPDHPLDTRFASHVEIRDRIFDEPATLCNTAAHATPSDFVLKAISKRANDTKPNYGMLFRKPALYTVPELFSSFEEIQLKIYQTANYTIYFCGENPKEPVVIIQTPPYNFNQTGQWTGITAVDIVPEKLKTSRTPCFGEIL